MACNRACRVKTDSGCYSGVSFDCDRDNSPLPIYASLKHVEYACRFGYNESNSFVFRFRGFTGVSLSWRVINRWFSMIITFRECEWDIAGLFL